MRDYVLLLLTLAVPQKSEQVYAVSIASVAVSIAVRAYCRRYT